MQTVGHVKTCIGISYSAIEQNIALFAYSLFQYGLCSDVRSITIIDDRAMFPVKSDMVARSGRSRSA
ncbi:MAG: hypothetical protein M0P29_07445 [Sphaerochaetaceae bacterium]|nr:hypothetical protein [Sphaerochaetaceae bacterium]